MIVIKVLLWKDWHKKKNHKTEWSEILSVYTSSNGNLFGKRKKVQTLNYRWHCTLDKMQIKRSNMRTAHFTSVSKQGTLQFLFLCVWEGRHHWKSALCLWRCFVQEQWLFVSCIEEFPILKVLRSCSCPRPSFGLKTIIDNSK